MNPEGGEPPRGAPPDRDALARLDPDRAASAPAPERAARPRPAISPRGYQWLAGGVFLILLIAFTIYQSTSSSVETVGVPAGHAVRMFSAPLATSSLLGDANLQPPCDTAHHDARALNICLLLRRGPLVLDFFLVGVNACERSVDAMQALVGRPAAKGMQFAAVAVHAGRAAVAREVRRHGWTIPVAYDRDGAVGASYGVVVCPLIELVHPGGVVATRLVGDQWQSPSALAEQLIRVGR